MKVNDSGRILRVNTVYGYMWRLSMFSRDEALSSILDDLG